MKRLECIGLISRERRDEKSKKKHKIPTRNAKVKCYYILKLAEMTYNYIILISLFLRTPHAPLSVSSSPALL